MTVKDQKVTHDEEIITISRPKFKCPAFVTYTEELFKQISSVTWIVARSKTGKEYLKSSKYGLLHQLVVNYFYGADVLKEAYANDYVIDHLDNNGYDCTYENLALIPKKENTAKGLTYDIEREQSLENFSINITKDFNTQEFQISIYFNKTSDIVIKNERIPLVTLYLRYGTDYKTAFIDARSILNDLNTGSFLRLSNLRYKGFDYCKAEVIFAKNEEIEAGFLMKDGQLYMIQCSPKTKLIKGKHYKDLHKD